MSFYSVTFKYKTKYDFRLILETLPRHTVLFIEFTDVQCQFSARQIMPGGKHVKDISVFVRKVYQLTCLELNPKGGTSSELNQNDLLAQFARSLTYEQSPLNI